MHHETRERRTLGLHVTHNIACVQVCSRAQSSSELCPSTSHNSRLLGNTDEAVEPCVPRSLTPTALLGLKRAIRPICSCTPHRSSPLLTAPHRSARLAQHRLAITMWGAGGQARM